MKIELFHLANFAMKLKIKYMSAALYFEYFDLKN